MPMERVTDGRGFRLRWSAGAMVFLVAAVGFAAGPQAEPEQSKERLAEFQEKVVAGGPADFMEVRHLVLRGSNYAIGRKLAEIGRTRHHTGPIPYPDHRRTRAQLRYFAKNYPIFAERMRGVASAFGTNLQNNAFNFAGLYYGFALPGCSVVFYPPNTTTAGEGVLSRNFDFTTGALNGGPPAEGSLPICARPYVVEMYPDEGYASLATYSFDLLSGACDGVNSEGLTVAILADSEVIKQGGIDPTPGPQPGFNEIQILRYLLDTCADVDQAQDALLEAKLYYNMFPNHYLIADRHGSSFVWENATVMHRGFIIPGGSTPLVTTNFMLHQHPDLEKLPPEEDRLGYFNRFRTIRKRIAEHEGKVDPQFIKATNREVSCTDAPPPAPYVPNRTLWYALYYPEQRRAEIDFYLGEEPDPASPHGVKIRRSGYQTFQLR